jgi:hypothetical protein
MSKLGRVMFVLAEMGFERINNYENMNLKTIGKLCLQTSLK